MTIIHILILLVTGMGAGFAGGLLGVGGAFIMTPVQYMVFTNIGIPSDTAIRLAFGTNLLVILPTALSGAWRHYRRGAVLWKAAIVMGGCSLGGALLGSTIAVHLPGTVLRIAFGVIVLASAVRMLLGGLPDVQKEPVTNPWVWVAWALPIGLLTGILGFGGGAVVIPVMVLALRFKMHNAIATSLAMMILTSFGGAIGYIINGIGVPNLPPYSLGYVNLTSWFLLSSTSIVMAQVGAITAHRIPANRLMYIFIILMVYVGLKMIGVFDWLNWPL